jgi:hypothetical protein
MSTVYRAPLTDWEASQIVSELMEAAETWAEKGADDRARHAYRLGKQLSKRLKAEQAGDPYTDADCELGAR